MDTWLAKDIKVQHIIVTRLTDNVTVHVLNCISAREIWKKLHTVYEQKGDTSVNMVQQQFFNLKFEPKMEMAVFISKVEELQCQLKQLGEEISELSALQVLPFSFGLGFNL